MHNIVYMEMKQKKTKQNKSSRRSKHLIIRVDYVCVLPSLIKRILVCILLLFTVSYVNVIHDHDILFIAAGHDTRGRELCNNHFLLLLKGNKLFWWREKKNFWQSKYYISPGINNEHPFYYFDSHVLFGRVWGV